MRIRILFSLLGFAFGSSVLVISLFSATQVSSNEGQDASEGKLYFSRQILPDHSFYKVLMAVDRLQLETASAKEQIYMRVEYAHRRLEYAQALLDKGNEELAMTTLLKSQNYLNQAAQAAMQDAVSSTTKERIAKAIRYHSQQLRQLAPRLTDAHRAQLDLVLSEHEILLTSLRTQVTARPQ